MATRIGWYRLPKSGVPYHGPIPEGVDEIDGPGGEAVDTKDVTFDAEADPAGFLGAGTVEEIVQDAEAYPIEVVRRLIESELVGQNRKTLLAKLDALARKLEEIPLGG